MFVLNFVKAPSIIFYDTTLSANNDNDVFIIEQWAQDALLDLESNIVAANLVHRNFEPMVAQKGETVTAWVPSDFSMKRKTDDDSVATQAASSTAVSVTLNQHLYVSFMIRDGEESKSYKTLREEYLSPAVKAIAQGLDEIVLSQVYQFRANEAGKLSTDITMDTIIDAEVAMDELKVPAYGRKLIVTPRAKGSILKVDSFVEADKRGDDGSAMRTGQLGTLFGFETFMCQNAPSISSAGQKATAQVNNATGYAIGTTTIEIDGITGSVPPVAGEWITIEGDMRPRKIISVIGTGTDSGSDLSSSLAEGETAIITLDSGLDTAVVNDADVTIYKAGAINQAVSPTGYAAAYSKEMVIDGLVTAPRGGQLVSIGAGASDALYGAVGTPTTTSIMLDRPLEAAAADNAVLGLGPDGDYNFAFNSNSLALVTRPLARPATRAGALSYVASYNGLSMRVTITYDGEKQGHLVTVDMLCGVKVLNSDLGMIIYS